VNNDGVVELTDDNLHWKVQYNYEPIFSRARPREANRLAAVAQLGIEHEMAISTQNAVITHMTPEQLLELDEDIPQLDQILMETADAADPPPELVWEKDDEVIDALLDLEKSMDLTQTLGQKWHGPRITETYVIRKGKTRRLFKYTGDEG
jgi:hypothetical protein